MDAGRRIVAWTVALCGVAFALGFLWSAGLGALVPLLPSVYVVPHTVARIHLERAMRRELRTMLDG